MIVGFGLFPRLDSDLRKALGQAYARAPPLDSEHPPDPRTRTAILFLDSRLGPEALRAMPHLEHVICASGGTDLVDEEACRARGVRVSRCSSYSVDSVCELAIGLAIMGLRDLAGASELARMPQCPLGVSLGRQLSGSRCAVLGTGAIGSRLCRLLLSFGCEVDAFSRSRKSGLESDGVRYRDLEDLLPEADLLFICLPAAPGTCALLSGPLLSLMKEGSAIINVSRAEIVDTKALLERIDRFLFVATDVVDGEEAFRSGNPLPPEAIELIGRPNVIRTAHIGGCTEEALASLSAEVLSHMVGRGGHEGS